MGFHDIDRVWPRHRFQPHWRMLPRSIRYDKFMENLPSLHLRYGDDDGGARFWFENGDSEDLLVTSLGGDLYRLEQSSFIGDAMYGDVVRAQR